LKIPSVIQVIAIALLVGGCASNPVVNKAQALPKNSEVLIGEFGYWKRDCSTRHFDIFIEEYPKAGDLRFEVGSLVIPDDPIIGSAGECSGLPVQSKRLIYIPDENFVGDDSVTYVVKSTKLLGDKAYDVSINVQ